MGYRYLFILLAGVIAMSLHGQVTVSPQFPTADMDITITYDAAVGVSQLAGVEAVMMHAGVITAGPQSTAWQYVVGTWGNPDAPGKMTAIGDNKWQITLNPRQYFAVAGLPANQTVYRIGMVFREAGPCGNFGGNSTPCKEGKSPSNSDIFVDLLTSGFEVKLEGIQPNSFWNMGDQLDISALSSAVADLKLEIQKAGVVVWDTTVESTERVDFTYMADQSGAYAVVLTGQRDGETRKDSIPFVVRGVVVEEARPAGLKKGVNFTGAGEVTMVLFAPGKSSVYAVGDFSDWAVDPKYLFKKDGDYFWLRIDGLNESIDYRFQFLVDEYRWLADPYSGIVLDPEDQYIPSSVYPQIPSFPSGARKPDWYHNRLSVIEWPKAPFNWTDQNWQRPAKEELVVYELLIRDFFDFNHRSFQALTDTLDYLKRLGINAIELMPVTEFNGNESWGYNPTFMFALDKAYGTRAQFKTFVNAAHAKGIAVITDVVLNHQDVPGSYLSMFFDYSNFQADAANPWFNVTARHPFNVFWDLNHESLLTQAYVDSVNAYWLREYHLDGFRYDLSKGFTQVNSGDDVSGWSAYDASRVALLKRMADRVWEVQPEAYVILEHFAANNEERELAEYGMMLWGNMNHSFSQLAMGYNAESDVRGTDARFRNWNQRHLISYMESHDEERLMFRNMNYGNANANYSTKSEQVAIDRMKAVSAFFYMIPGPKMLWQFGELGFDYSINRCTDGTISNDCRLAVKPTVWQYRADSDRARLYDVTASLLRLKGNHDLFSHGDVTWFNANSLVRYFWVTDNEQTDGNLEVVVMGNFDLSTRETDASFPSEGTWFHYFDKSDSVVVVGSATTIRLQPGEVRIYTNERLSNTQPELFDQMAPLAPSSLHATDAEQGIELMWQNPSRLQQQVKVYRKTLDSDWQLIAELQADASQYLDDQVMPGKQYAYRVANINSIGERVSDAVDVAANSFVLGLPIQAQQIYPNPAREGYVVLPNGATEVELVNLAGQRLGRRPVQDGKLTLSGLVPGIYFVEWKMEGDLHRERLIIH